jgi:hypothetical protein
VKWLVDVDVGEWRTNEPGFGVEGYITDFVDAFNFFDHVCSFVYLL